ncbi:hypothetical protein LshimejAT787_0304980 [Lyophyllum shimeji]|uniref:Uncharacterized protein n=1 Tax=Lyophyllum shimeji TaxID=47721 RepID=A0A9P3PHI8_LYOSH|nr:hypothetical protein LshimejAT787_0304980 [Lyophyllum shimeji]
MSFLPQTHNPHKPLSVQIPTDEYNHGYVSSSENPYAYSQGFSSPSVAASPFYAASATIDAYQPDTDPRSPWPASSATYGVYDNHPLATYDAAEFSRPSPMTSQCPELPLHAPAPLPGQPSALLFSGAESFEGTPIRNLPSPNHFSFPAEDHRAHLAPQPESEENSHSLESHPRPTQSTFPTPSEMLSELSGNPQPPAAVGPHALEGRSEPVRKARRRAMAQNIGFLPTDPDSISSHDKKRHYLACLEYYVLYLHQQLNLVGAKPVVLQRVQTPGRGMSSRSIRTLLVHMGHVNRRLNQQILAEEQRFAHLRDALSQQTEVPATQHRQMTLNDQHQGVQL